MAILPASIRARVSPRVRDDVRTRALALSLGLIPPRGMHSERDLGVLLAAASGARRAVEIGVYEGASALALMGVLGAGAELHLVDPFGHHPDALPSGWGASERATRLTVARAALRMRGSAPRVRWHIASSEAAARGWRDGELDLVFIDGDHSEAGCELDWRMWSALVAPGGRVVLHDARAGRAGGRGLPGPSAVVARLLAPGGAHGWELLAEADRTVALGRIG